MAYALQRAMLVVLVLAGCDRRSDATPPMPPTDDVAVNVAASSVPSADDSRPDGTPFTLVLSGDAKVTFTPIIRDGPNGQRCEIRIAQDGAQVQNVMSLPSAGQGTEASPDDVPEACLGLKALGRVPAPAGTDRIGLIYTAFSGGVLRPDNSYDVALILVRKDGQSGWRLDEDLARAAYEAEITNIPQMRKWLSRK